MELTVKITSHNRKQLNQKELLLVKLNLPEKPLQDILKEQEKCGSEFFQMCLYQKNLLKLGWAKVKVQMNIGLVELNQVGLCLK